MMVVAEIPMPLVTGVVLSMFLLSGLKGVSSSFPFSHRRYLFISYMGIPFA